MPVAIYGKMCHFADKSKSNYQIMCTYNITVSEDVLAMLEPRFSRESFGAWLQQHVDELLGDISTEIINSRSPIAHTSEEMKTIVEERLRLMESGQATYIDGEEGFAKIRARYGL